MLLAKGCFLGSSDLSVDQPDRPQSLLGLLLASRNASTHALFLQSPLFWGGAAWKRRCRDVAPPPADVRAHHPHRRGGRPRHRGPPCATVAAACTQCTPPTPPQPPLYKESRFDVTRSAGVTARRMRTWDVMTRAQSILAFIPMMTCAHDLD